MIILGIVLLVLAVLLPDVFPVTPGLESLLYDGGVILIILGIIFWILGATGHAVGGRRHYF
jgi:hypothetical protein